MEEKTLLAEIEEEQKRKIEESFLEHKNKRDKKVKRIYNQPFFILGI